MGRWHHSSSLQPPVLFCVEHNWSSRCFRCENYEEILKKWNRWTYSIFILAIWFSTNYFGEPSRERSGLFPGISQTLEDKLFSSLPITSAKKCRKAKWKKSSWGQKLLLLFCLDMVIYKKKVARCLFHPSLEKALLGSLTLTSWSWFREK